MIYLDNAATTSVDKEVARTIFESLTTDFANPSSLYKIGAQSEHKIDGARKAIGETINAKQEEIYFTACATESNNIAIYGLALMRKNWGNKIVTTGYEHPAVRKPLELLKELGFEIIIIAPDEDGNVSVDKIIKAVDDKTVLVTIIHVNNETGATLDIETVAQMVKAKNRRTAVHVDATQSFMKLPLDMARLKIDALSFSGHKINAPKGIGGLYIKKGTSIKAVFLGGGQEKGLRGGTENIHYILGLQKACEILKPEINKHLEIYDQLKSYLLDKLATFDNVVINSPQNAIPYTVNFSFLNYRSETLLHFLEKSEIYISSGSACSKGQQSHTLSQMGLSKKRIDSAIRVSFGTQNTMQDIDGLIEALNNATKELQRVK